MLQTAKGRGTDRAVPYRVHTMHLHALDAWVRDPAVLTDLDRLARERSTRAPRRAARPLGEEFRGFPNGAVTGVLCSRSRILASNLPEYVFANLDPLSYGDVHGERVLEVSARPHAVRSRVACIRGQLAERAIIVTDVAEPVGLSEGERGVRDVLAALARLEPISTRRLSRAAGLPVPIVASVCGERRKRDVVSVERPAQLTAAGRALFAGGALAIPTTTRGSAPAEASSSRTRSHRRFATSRAPPRRRRSRASSSTSATRPWRRSSAASSRSTRRTRSSGSACCSSATTT